jgi:hypothetical protein
VYGTSVKAVSPVAEPFVIRQNAKPIHAPSLEVPSSQSTSA